MLFNIIASGSKGNATLVIYKSTVILIDMGIPFVRLEEGLKEVNKTFEDINGAIFTHNHTDHISGVKFLSPKKMYGLKGTLSSLANVIELFVPFKIGELEITPIKTSHDAINPCGFFIKGGDETLVYMTDTGCFCEENLPLIKNPTYLIIESNHDIQMELKTNRSYALKQRIISDEGHLCNEDSAIAACEIIGERTKEIVLAHLSEEANTPELALKAYEKIFKHFNMNINKYKVRCAKQWESLLGGHLDEN